MKRFTYKKINGIYHVYDSTKDNKLVKRFKTLTKLATFLMLNGQDSQMEKLLLKVKIPKYIIWLNYLLIFLKLKPYIPNWCLKIEKVKHEELH